MLTFAEIWPPYGLSVTEGDLVLSTVTDGDIPGLVELALAGIHAPDQMPFSTPWTLDDPATLPANNVRYYSGIRAAFSPEEFSLVFTVRVAGELVGVQGLTTHDFALTRTGETGSWLGRRYQGRGIGTRMRRAVCALAFDGLGAVQVTSGAFLDNPASLAVSRKVGYLANGVDRRKRRPGEVVPHQLLLLTPDSFVRGGPVGIHGLAPFRAFVGLPPSDTPTEPRFS